MPASPPGGAGRLTVGLELADERLRGDVLDVDPGRRGNGAVAGDEHDVGPAPVLGGEPLEQRVGMGGEANLERPVDDVLPHPVEHDDAPGAALRHEGRERVGELARRRERAGVEQVVAVEQIQRRCQPRCRFAS